MFSNPTRLICTCRLVGFHIHRDPSYARPHTALPLAISLSRLPFVSQRVFSVILCIINSACDKNFFDRFPSQWSKFRDLITTCLNSGLALSPQLWYCRWMTWPGCFLGGRLFLKLLWLLSPKYFRCQQLRLGSEIRMYWFLYLTQPWIFAVFISALNRQPLVKRSSASGKSCVGSFQFSFSFCQQ